MSNATNGLSMETDRDAILKFRLDSMNNFSGMGGATYKCYCGYRSAAWTTMIPYWRQIIQQSSSTSHSDCYRRVKLQLLLTNARTVRRKRGHGDNETTSTTDLDDDNDGGSVSIDIFAPQCLRQTHQASLLSQHIYWRRDNIK